MHLVIAMTPTGLIGAGNGLPWHFPSDLRFFKNLTEGSTIIMGSNTAKHPAFPLPNRRNVVVTTSRAFYPGFDTWKTLPHYKKDCYLIGGAQLIESGIDLCEFGFITLIHGTFSGDVYLSQRVMDKINSAKLISSNLVYEEGVTLEFRLVKF
ncbi:dihydrofolate reductase [Vibrio phage JSF12]|uniref:dihydrofolate reductase n=2 Tax=Jesfedecavirus TaxID=2560156 RepID=A0A2D0YX56_9CAUD|nr:dihydrofolate reductase [Vibrio phage JSF10]YP_009794719.1 dihydrofolate reductase [Vibrio phage JSF12]ASV43394.1 dihydrofolate reductase [Vibrio phage JSF10]ASV43554.1 dihydrofolate reductase [Vibrio phage JSF12]